MLTVLVIEDQPSNMQAFCLLFSARGFKVLEATTGQEAMVACNRSDTPIDLILCDLELPDTSGVKVMRELVRSHPEPVILFISGTPQAQWSNNDLDDLRKLPAEKTDFLEKPFLPSVLATRVEALLNRTDSSAPRHPEAE